MQPELTNFGAAPARPLPPFISPRRPRVLTDRLRLYTYIAERFVPREAWAFYSAESRIADGRHEVVEGVERGVSDRWGIGKPF